MHEALDGLLQAAIFRKLAGQAHELKLIQEALILLERERQQQDIRDAKMREESLKKLIGCLSEISFQMSQSLSESDVSEKRNEEKSKLVKNKIEELRIREEVHREYEDKMKSFVEEKEKELEERMKMLKVEKDREVEEQVKNVMQENELLRTRLKIEQFQNQILQVNLTRSDQVRTAQFHELQRQGELRQRRSDDIDKHDNGDNASTALNDSEYPISLDASLSNLNSGELFSSFDIPLPVAPFPTPAKRP
ncbi:hypothetical protein GUITHDRAFT_114858 [Guillardia theta CCMP2712]|uniref:Uncharacterized protein n=1 Tax=Guillardia theta (strain CCMP2712) TaxID=905079 RepID=L1IRV9_GUITC|nr:hypothetical protein GUITHDRAFT_114858 [Guillardia theta CCMP2712]EKX38978.1 hypothetical protein GUITHDRAFT_114858 [Guillardia theta CCMP2712]|eukprot:XP_005825958.1 hypothetical protein GUITHDRAFT_114858 [Guillardia theta CCMP2712]